MARTRPDKPKLPTAHLSPVTWAAIIGVAAAILLFVMWAIWFAEPGILRGNILP